MSLLNRRNNPSLSQRRSRISVVLLIVGLVASGLLGWTRYKQIEFETKQRFQHYADLVTANVTEKYSIAVYGLLGARGMYAADPDVRLNEFRAYVDSRDVQKEFSGIRGFGFIERVPRDDLQTYLEHARTQDKQTLKVRHLGDQSKDDLLLIRYIEPEERNKGARGLDIGSETKRRAAALAAIDTGMPNMTGAIKLVQDKKATPGVLLFVPVYRTARPPVTVGERRQNLRGLLYEPIVIHELLGSVYELTNNQVSITIEDITDSASADVLLNGLPDAAGALKKISAVENAFNLSVPLEVYGRKWQLNIVSTNDFDQSIDRISPWAFFLIGLVLTTLLSWRVRQQGLDKRRAENLASKMTEELRRDQERNRDFSMSASDWFWETDAHHRFSYFSENFASVYKRDPTALIGLSRRQLLQDSPSKDFQLFEEHFRQLDAHQAFRDFEYQIRGSDGSLQWISVSGVPHFNEKGEFAGYRGTGRNVTRQKEQELEIQRQRKRLQEILEGTHVGTWEYDISSRRLVWDDTMLSLYGIAQDDFAGTHDDWLLRVHLDDREQLDSAIVRASLGQSSFDANFRVVHPKGAVHWIHALAATQFDEQGKPVRLVGTSWDTTRERQADQAKNEFVSTVSHELRTPLTSISGSLGLVTGGALGEVPATMKAMLDIAHKNSKRLAKLIDDLLDIEKLIAGKMKFNLQIQYLMPLIEESIESTRAYADRLNVRLAIVERADEVQVNVDSGRLQQVMANFLSNAAKFSPSGGQVDICVRRLGQSVAISVIDRGEGIPEEFRSRIFQKFSQADASDGRTKGGTGLGLAICKELIERMSGSIGFQSQVGHGSTFYFELPIWSDQELVSTPQLLPGSMSASRILVVEDEPDIANLLMVILNQRGYNVDIAPDAATAYTLATSIDYDAITLDLILPDCSGVDLLQQLRSEVRTANIPVVMVSAYVEEGALAISSAASVIDWVKKPFDPGRLIEAVNRAIKVRNSAESTSQMHVLHVEDEIDFARVIQASTPPDLKLDHASSLAQARRFLASKAYDVVIIDVGLPDGNGLHLINDIRSISPPPEVIVLSGLDLDPSELEVVQAVLKKSPDSTEKVLQLLDSQLKSKAQS